ncbi:MAG: hypothetical protein EXS08_12420 [Planctomycetes bacterium]|nr:hypothetical protein [Planctomycetota bacterium]
MRVSRSLFALSFQLPCTLAAAPLFQGAQQAVALPEGLPVRWGLVRDCERPFLDVGATLHARHVLANSSQLDAAGWSSTRGSNGCAFRFTLEDPAGQVVWEPGSWSGGVFTPPGCTFGMRPRVLPGKSALQGTASVPLVYQNSANLGAQGQALPAGPYHLVAEVQFSGPERPPSNFGLGLTYSARLPIRIE